MAQDSQGSMKLSTLLGLVVGTAALVALAIFALREMQPVVLRGVAVQERLRNGRTVLSLRTRGAAPRGGRPPKISWVN